VIYVLHAYDLRPRTSKMLMGMSSVFAFQMLSHRLLHSSCCLVLHYETASFSIRFHARDFEIESRKRNFLRLCKGSRSLKY
jgi:hypothetical protein